MNLSGRSDVNIRPRHGMGKATSLLGETRPVTFLLTTRCDLACRHCYWPKGTKPLDLEPELIKATADELRGHERIYFSGGEPFQYLAKAGGGKAFLDLMHYVADRAYRIYIDTNGAFLPEDEKTAESFIEKLPEKTTIVLSFDKYHHEALERKGRSLARIFKNLANIYWQGGSWREGWDGITNINKMKHFRLELNCRRARLSEESVLDFASDLGINERNLLKYVRDPWGHLIEELWFPIHGNTILCQGKARGFPPAKTRQVSLSDFVSHIGKIGSIGIFITPKGLVVSGEHAAFLESPPDFCVMGDLHQNTLASILANHKERKYKVPSPEELFVIATDSTIPVSWEVDFKAHEKKKRFLECFGEAAIKKAADRALRESADNFPQDQIGPGNIYGKLSRRGKETSSFTPRFVVRNGELFFELTLLCKNGTEISPIKNNP